MEANFDALSACPLFAGVAEGELRSMLGCLQARTVAVRRGEAVLREDAPAEYVGVVLEGGVRVLRVDYYGNRTIQAAIAPGELFGEAFACAGVKRLPVSVEADQAGKVLLLRVDKLIATCPSACDFHNRVVLNLLRVMAQKNLMLNQKLEITGQRTTRDKLMAYLLAQAKRAGGDAFTIPFDRQGLADFLGVDRSALSAEIGKLRREGVLESERSAFRLLGGARER